MKKFTQMTSMFIIMLLTFQGCEQLSNPLDTPEISNQSVDRPNFTKKSSAPAPAPLAMVDGVEFWPYTGVDFTGNPSDPINLIIKGADDPRQLRSGLMSLNGDRTPYGFPDTFPFNLTWTDAIGGVQTSFGGSEGWIANVVQLELGDYNEARFHVRFFDIGDFTLGAAHLDVLIPNTTEHVVISWEVPEQLLMVDLMRLGASISTTAVINASPSFRDIPVPIYNSIPVELRGLIGGPLENVSAPVPVATDGKATIIELSSELPASSGKMTQEFVIDFDQTIPKPFCSAGEFDFIHVQGPVKLRQKTVETPSGNLISQFHATGHLNITPVPDGESYKAVVNEHHKGIVTDNVTLASNFQMQVLIPPSRPFRGRLLINLNVGPGDSNHYSMDIRCEP